MKDVPSFSGVRVRIGRSFGSRTWTKTRVIKLVNKLLWDLSTSESWAINYGHWKWLSTKANFSGAQKNCNVACTCTCRIRHCMALWIVITRRGWLQKIIAKAADAGISLSATYWLVRRQDIGRSGWSYVSRYKMCYKVLRCGTPCHREKEVRVRTSGDKKRACYNCVHGCPEGLGQQRSN